MKIVSAMCAALLLTGTSALAQTGPGGVPYGAGVQRGMQQVNNSGQTGFVTLLSGHRVVVAVESAHGRPEAVAIARGRSCSDPVGTVAERLPDLNERGVSRGMSRMSQERLLSGNYVAVVMQGTHLVSCGELYQ